MIVTLTLNPSLDRTIEVERLEPGHGHPRRRRPPRPGRQGRERLAGAARANRCRRAPCCPSAARRATSWSGCCAPRASTWCAVRDRRRAPGRTSPWPSPTAPSPRSTNPARRCRPTSSTRSPTRCWQPTEAADWVAACGSLPPGVAGRLLRAPVPAAGRGRDQGRRRHQRAGPARRGRRRPDGLIKPNREELAEAVGAPLRSRRRRGRGRPGPAVQGRARRVWPASAPTAPCWSTDDGVVSGDAHVAEPRSTVGAGDALLAGFLAAGADGAGGARRRPRLGGRRRRPARQPDAGARTRSTAPRPAARPHEPVPTAGLVRLTGPRERPDRHAPTTSRLLTKRGSHVQLHPRRDRDGCARPHPAVRQLPLGHGDAQHRGVHRLRPHHRAVHPGRLDAQRGPRRDGRPDDHRAASRP